MGEKQAGFFFCIGWVEGEVVLSEGGHEAVGNVIGPVFVFPALACLLPEAMGVDFLGEFNGVMVVSPEEENTGMVGGKNGRVLPAREEGCRLVLDPPLDGLSGEQGFGGSG